MKCFATGIDRWRDNAISATYRCCGAHWERSRCAWHFSPARAAIPYPDLFVLHGRGVHRSTIDGYRQRPVILSSRIPCSSDKETKVAGFAKHTFFVLFFCFSPSLCRLYFDRFPYGRRIQVSSRHADCWYPYNDCTRRSRHAAGRYLYEVCVRRIARRRDEIFILSKAYA